MIGADRESGSSVFPLFPVFPGLRCRDQFAFFRGGIAYCWNLAKLHRERGTSS